MTDWKEITDAWPPAGRYLVTVETDNGREVHALERDKKLNWIHEGEETFCHGYYFNPISWENLPMPDEVTVLPQLD